MKRKIENLGSVDSHVVMSDIEELAKIQAIEFEQAKQNAIITKNTDVDDGDFLSIDELKAKLKRETKKPISIRFDSDIYDWMKSYGKGYQTAINNLFRGLKDGHYRIVTNKKDNLALPMVWPPSLEESRTKKKAITK